jgi:hypothetical protein
MNTKIMHTAFANSIAGFAILFHLQKHGPDSRTNIIDAVSRRLAGMDQTSIADVTRVTSAAIQLAIDCRYVDGLSGYRLRITEEGAAMSEKLQFFYASILKPTQP